MRILRLCFVVLLSMISVISVAGAPRNAQTAAAACPIGGCKGYLPLLTYQVTPALLAPADAAQLSSLAPLLSWRPVVSGLHKIQMSTDASFSPSVTLAVSTTKQVKLPLPAQVDTEITSNLKTSTTYYWRVGVALAQGDTYSPVQSFTTPETVVLPGIVPIISPRNNASLTGSRVLLKWGAVPGALLYRIRMFDANGNQFGPGTEEVDGNTVALWVENMPKGAYTWKIKVLTVGGWGPYGDDFSFKLS